VLVPMRVLSCTKVNMKGAATAGGEWTDKAAEERGMDIVGDVVHEWIKHAEGRKTIVFGSTIAHVEGLVREFNSAGIMAAAFTAETTDTERKDILDDFKAPDTVLRVLVSVEALAKGFDQKDVSCVCDVRPLRKSLSTAIQMWGRGLRASPETGKTYLLLLDFSGNIVRFSEDYETIYHDGLDALDMGDKLDKTIRKDDEEESDAPVKCPKCSYSPFRKRCVSCGHEVIKPNLIEHEAGEMMEFKVGKATVGDKLTVWEQSVTLCRGQGNQASAKGRAAHLFKSITGAFPRNLPDFDVVRNVPISRAVMNKAKANAIAFRAAQ
jgi:DNA repair protein RadD